MAAFEKDITQTIWTMHIDHQCIYTTTELHDTLILLQLRPLNQYGPQHYKTCLQGFPQSEIQTSLLSYWDYLENEILLEANLDMILSKKRITTVLIRLRGCAGWSAVLLFANLRRQVFSRWGLYWLLDSFLIGNMYYRWVAAKRNNIKSKLRVMVWD